MPGMVAHTFISSTQEVEAGKFKTSLVYTEHSRSAN